MPKDSKPPAFQFYVDDFSSDGNVEAMTTKEVGAYILLMCKAWREEPPGSIPNDDRVLARWSRLAPDEWSECRTGVLAAFRLGTDSRWHQKRLRKEYDKLLAFQKDRSVNGKKGAETRWLGHSSAIAKPMANDSSSPSSSSSPSVQRERERGATWPKLEEVKTKAQFIGCSEADAEAFFHHFESAGWIDKNGHPIVNWQSKLATWTTNARAKPVEQAHKASEGKSRSDTVAPPMTVASLNIQKEAIEKQIQSFMTEKYIDLEWKKCPKPGKEVEVAELRKKLKEIRLKITAA